MKITAFRLQRHLGLLKETDVSEMRTASIVTLMMTVDCGVSSEIRIEFLNMYEYNIYK
jgi:hypothetical protein